MSDFPEAPSNAPPSESYEKNAVINGLRGFAILGVIHQHVFSYLTPPGHGAIQLFGFDFFPYAIAGSGWLGVNLFFILSGFVLFAPYHANLRSMTSREDAIAFYVKRARRLLPLYYLMIVLGWGVFSNPATRSTGDLLYLLTLTFPFTADTFFPMFSIILWSIGVEIWLSIVFPLMVIAYQRIGIWKLLPLAMLLSLFVRWVGNSSRFWGSNPLLNWVRDSFVGRLDDLVLGMAIVCLYHRYKDTPISLGRTIVGLIVGLLALQLAASTWDSMRLGNTPYSFAPVTNNVVHVAFFLVTMSLLLTKNRILQFIVTNRPIQLMGMMCYSLYVWHYYVALNLAERTAPNLLMGLAVLMALSALTYRYVEFGHVKDLKKLFWPARP
jgi:peptidoglycan/LPS O-acetylase OafA/YrhL